MKFPLKTWLALSSLSLAVFMAGCSTPTDETTSPPMDTGTSSSTSTDMTPMPGSTDPMPGSTDPMPGTATPAPEANPLPTPIVPTPAPSTETKIEAPAEPKAPEKTDAPKDDESKKDEPKN